MSQYGKLNDLEQKAAQYRLETETQRMKTRYMSQVMDDKDPKEELTTQKMLKRAKKTK